MKNENKPSEKEYDILRNKFMEDMFGDRIKKCRQCGYPCLDGYVCKHCNCQEP